MDKILEKIGLFGILPIVTFQDDDNAALLANTMSENGLPIIEITFRTKAAVSAIEKIVKDAPQVLVGAGTILTMDDAQKAVDAGARFVVSPGFDPKIIEFCLYKSIPVIPGVITPTEIQYAVEHGLKVVKLFPIGPVGGVSYLKAVSAPFPDLKFIPTGGIDDTTLLSYLQHPKVLACGGSWLIPSEHIKTGQFEKIAECVRHTIASMLGFDLRHIGMNLTSSDEARNVVDILEKTFHLESHETEGSIFAGTQFEVLKQPNLGAHGHIGIKTNFIERAIAHLALNGIGIKEESKNVQNGKLKTVYLDLEVGGFAFHLVQV